MIGAAILTKELRVSGHRRLGYVARAGYLLLLLGVVLLAFSGASRAGLGRGIAELQALQRLAPVLTLVILWFQFVILSLAGPLTTAGAICDERRARTLATLATTPLSSLSIVVGKIASRFVHLALMCLLAAPMLLALRVFGGVEAEVILGGTVVTITTGLMAASLALLASVRARSSTTAALFGLVTSAGFHLIPIIAGSLLIASRGGNGPTWWLVSSCAPMTMAALSEPNISGFLGVPVWNVWLANAGYSALITLLAVALASRSLRRVLQREGEESAPAAKARLSRRDRVVSDAPVLWRELRQRAFSRRIFSFVVPLVVLGATLTVVVLSALDDWNDVAWWLYPASGLATIFTLSAAAIRSTAAIAGERDARTWDVLLTTQLSAREIVFGKLLGQFRRHAVYPACSLIPFLVSVLILACHPIALLHHLLLWTGASIFLLGTGVLAGLVVKRTLLASAVNLAFAVAIWGGVWVIVWIVAIFFGGDDPDALIHLFAAINPVALGVFAVDGAVDQWGSDGPSLSYDLFDAHLGAVGFTTLVGIVSIVYAILGFAAAHVAARIFPEATGRYET